MRRLSILVLLFAVLPVSTASSRAADAKARLTRGQGTLALGNAALELGFQQEDGRCRLVRLVNRQAGRQMTVASDDFSIGIDGHEPLAAADFSFKEAAEEAFPGGLRLVLRFDGKTPGTALELVYELDDADCFARRRLELTTDKPLALRRVDVWRVGVAGECSHQGFGEPVFLEDTFWGLEFPAGHNACADGVVQLTQYPGRTVTGRFTSKTAVVGGVRAGTRRAAVSPLLERMAETAPGTLRVAERCPWVSLLRNGGFPSPADPIPASPFSPTPPGGARKRFPMIDRTWRRVVAGAVSFQLPGFSRGTHPSHGRHLPLAWRPINMPSINLLTGFRSCVTATSVLLCSVAAAARPAPSVIPQPVAMAEHDGTFAITENTPVVASGDAAVEAAKLIDTLAPAMGFRLRQVDAPAKPDHCITLSLDASLREKLGDEGYTLNVTAERIEILAASSAGLFYGSQTLRQLLPPSVFSRKTVEDAVWAVPCVLITDHPRFSWRGLLIDPARHFIPVADVKRFVDAMALHKFNRLQVHLTDNEGWRIEIKKYPELTRLGSDMDWSLRRRGERGPHCFGFYTQDDIRELVRYAADRHVTIVPEIEMPYHTGAAIVAYPELGINTGHLAGLAPGERWGKTKGLIAPRPRTVAFFQDVLVEVMDLFPGTYIHIGGDEANLRLWADDPEMQELMKHLKLASAHELHSWFVKQMDAFLTKHDRRLVGWDEILQGGLAPGATVMSWRGTGGGIAAAGMGHDVVMAPTSHTYFDYRQAPAETGLGSSVIDVKKVYTFEPIPAELNAEQAKHVLGAQAQLWGELIFDEDRREYMTYPRACALIECVWSPKGQRDYNAFSSRLKRHLSRLESAGINYRALDTD